MMSNKYAPIVLFVYNRLDHTKSTIQALKDNHLAQDSELYIFSDKEKASLEKVNVDEVRNYLPSIDGFRNVNIIYREKNFGLAASIISGVSHVIEKHGSAIVLEDDIVTSPYFLQFMNEALDKYKDNEKVWHISGWNYPINVTSSDLDAFFWRGMNCWGWATWADRWQYFEKNPQYLVDNWEKSKIHKFNIDGSTNFWSQVLANHSGELSTWAIFWYATIFEHDGLCLNPYKTLVDNIGNDGSGENCIDYDFYKSRLLDKPVEHFPDLFYEDSIALAEIKKFNRTLTPSFPQRALRKLMSILNENLNCFSQR